MSLSNTNKLISHRFAHLIHLKQSTNSKENFEEDGNGCLFTILTFDLSAVSEGNTT